MVSRFEYRVFLVSICRCHENVIILVTKNKEKRRTAILPKAISYFLKSRKKEREMGMEKKIYLSFFFFFNLPLYLFTKKESLLL